MSTHETGQQRYRRLKADKLRHSQIAPSHPVEPVVCACGHAQLLHVKSSHPQLDGRCQSISTGCGCTEYREAP